MNPLQQRLWALRRRLRLVVTFRGLCWVISLALTVAILTGWLDWSHHLPSLVRATVLVGVLSGAGYVGYRYLVRPLAARADDLTLALQVERLYPALGDSLASTVQFLEEPEDSERTGSPGMRRAAVQRTLRLAAEYDFHKVVSTRGLRLAGLSLAGSAILALVILLLWPARAWTALARLADPFGRHDWPSQTRLEIMDYQARVARGEPYEIHAAVSGVVPENAVITFEGLAPARQVFAVNQGKLVARLDRVEDNFKFRVWANDAVSDNYPVAVLPPPVLIPIGERPSPQVHLVYPAYTDLPEQDLPDGSGNIEAVAGTRVLFRAGTDRPISQAWIEYRPEGQLVRESAFLGPLGAACPGATAALLLAGQEVLGRVPVRLEGDGRVLAAEFLPRVTGVYALHFEDESGLGSTRLFDLKIHPDPAPVVNLERPSKSHDSLDVLPGADVHVQLTAEDREFALRSAYLEYRCRREDPPRRLPLYDHQGIGQGVPQLLTALADSSWPGVPLPTSALRLRPQQLAITRLLSLSEIKHLDQTDLREGDIVLLQACADDFDDVAVDKQPGRSHEIELHIVGRPFLENKLNQDQTQVQEELLRLRKMEQEALEHVIGPEQRWRNTGNLGPRDLDQLRQAEQLQQQLRARVGDQKDGLRAEVARILEALKDNHLPPSSTRERMETVAGELDRLAREDLEQIESNLTNARKENEIAPDHPKPPPGNKGLIGAAREHQEEVENTLTNLLKLLEPWGNVNAVKSEARSLLQEQRSLAEQTGELEKHNLGLGRDQLTPEQQAALDRLAELQGKLAQRTQQLLEKMERAGASKDRQEKDPETAAALTAAAQQGRQADLPGQMKEAGDQIRNNHLNSAGERQTKSAQALEQMVQNLEERREKELARLQKKLQAAGDQVADLARRQAELRKKIQQAAQLADPMQRQQALQALAPEQEQLRKEAQNLVRELTRLRAEQAGQVLNGAAGSMEQAGQQLTQGQEAQDPEEDALDRLQDVERRLNQAKAAAEEELGREKLAKVADQIKLLKERQEAADAEMDRLQQEALKRRGWDRVLQNSLNDEADVQKGLAQETDSLAKGKLATTKVLAHLLTRSSQSMDQAAEEMRARLDQLKVHPEDTTEDAEVRRWQQDAGRRLAQLLDVLKPDKNQSRPGSSGGGGSNGGEGGSAPGAGEDWVPPLAQLKALRLMQQEVTERTEAFARKHPRAAGLSTRDKRELQALRDEQREVAQLFDDLNPPAEPEGGKP
ncbi:MAG: hypothetical protein JO112_03410 [Planctomycetes bacterium]|nr:hypothetical protein [Planctomycetota bacterium]